jgi:hypothetical protein
MAKVLLQEIRPYVKLYRDPKTGIAWVEDGRSGNAHSAHPNIDSSGSVAGMRKLGYWGKKDQTVRSHGFIYNIDRSVVHDEFDRLAAEHCRCGGNHGGAFGRGFGNATMSLSRARTMAAIANVRLYDKEARRKARELVAIERSRMRHR